MMFSTFKMDCGGRIAYSLKPTMWTGGMRPRDGLWQPSVTTVT